MILILAYFYKKFNMIHFEYPFAVNVLKTRSIDLMSIDIFFLFDSNLV